MLVDWLIEHREGFTALEFDRRLLNFLKGLLASGGVLERRESWRLADVSDLRHVQVWCQLWLEWRFWHQFSVLFVDQVHTLVLVLPLQLQVLPCNLFSLRVTCSLRGWDFHLHITDFKLRIQCPDQAHSLPNRQDLLKMPAQKEGHRNVNLVVLSIRGAQELAQVDTSDHKRFLPMVSSCHLSLHRRVGSNKKFVIQIWLQGCLFQPIIQKRQVWLHHWSEQFLSKSVRFLLLSGEHWLLILKKQRDVIEQECHSQARLDLLKV